MDVAEDNGQFSTLVKALETTGLDKTLASQGPFTVFAPTDAAFEKLPEGKLDELMNDEAALTRVLTYHLVSGEVPANKVKNMSSASTVAGPSLDIKAQGSTVMVEDARIVNADVKASNGIIHAIDKVLLPPGSGERQQRPSRY